MTNVKQKLAKVNPSPATQSEFVGFTVNQLVELASADPAKVPAIRAHAAAKLLSLAAKGCRNTARLSAWQSLADGTMRGWDRQPVKPKASVKAKATAPKAAGNDELKELLAALIAKL